jgi:predicted RNase H-like HicB family nuclease
MKMDHPCFTLDYWKDGRRFVGRLREVPNVISQGRTLEELKENIRDAYRLITEDEMHNIVVGQYRSTMVGIPL